MSAPKPAPKAAPLKTARPGDKARSRAPAGTAAARPAAHGRTPAGRADDRPVAERQAAPRPTPVPSPAPMPPSSPEGWSDADLDRLQSLLDAVPAPLEPLDVSMLDGFLVAVILQPKPVALSAWWPWVLDSEGRPAPPRFDGQPLLALVQRRHRELAQAIAERQWFDPWVFELDEEASPSETVLPWVAGFGLAADLFPGLMGLDEGQLTEPLAQLYMHLDPEDLEDADTLLEEIESLEPPDTLDEAVECLVRASLLLADVSQPRAAAGGRPGGRTGGRPGAPPAGTRRGGPRR